MGYQTDFEGKFKLDRALAPEHKAYLEAFARTRRMKRDVAVTASRPDPVREATDLPVGDEGGYFVGEGGLAGQVDDGRLRDYREREALYRSLGILDYNTPPAGQPNLWFQWVPNDDGTAIEWNGTEKFYGYVQWLEYLIAHFLQPWGYVLGGEVDWRGEDYDDRGTIYVSKNRVRAIEDVIAKPEPNFEVP